MCQDGVGYTSLGLDERTSLECSVGQQHIGSILSYRRGETTWGDSADKEEGGGWNLGHDSSRGWGNEVEPTKKAEKEQPEGRGAPRE